MLRASTQQTENTGDSWRSTKRPCEQTDPPGTPGDLRQMADPGGRRPPCEKARYFYSEMKPTLLLHIPIISDRADQCTPSLWKGNREVIFKQIILSSQSLT